MDYVIKDGEQRIAPFIRKQILDKQNPEYGAFYLKPDYTEPKPVAYKACSAIALYLNENSSYYGKSEVYQFVLRALEYVAKTQREDGTFDLVDCNFNSAADTAFLVKHLALSYRLLEQYPQPDHEHDCNVLKETLCGIITHAVRGMIMGGFHTPNHRWAIASVLGLCDGIATIDSAEIKQKINAYLIEGIDCNEDGEYAERSAATYNLVNNSAMLFLYEYTQDASYLEHVCKNLEMMRHYFDPDGSIFTENSTRQDRGKAYYPRDYFYYYLSVGHQTNHIQFLSTAHQIIKDHQLRNAYHKESLAPDCLDLLMLSKPLLSIELPEPSFLSHYQKFYHGSGVVRYRNDNYALSIIQNNSKVLVMKTKDTDLYLKIGVGYFEHRDFVAQSIVEQEGGYLLSFCADGWYYEPFAEKPESADWWMMDHRNRKKIVKNQLCITLLVKPEPTGISLSLQTKGCDRALLRVEFGLPADGYLDHESFYQPCVAGAASVVKSGVVRYHHKEDLLEIGAAFAEHLFLDGKFGSDPRSPFHHTLYFTATTNTEQHFFIKRSKLDPGVV